MIKVLKRVDGSSNILHASSYDIKSTILSYIHIQGIFLILCKCSCGIVPADVKKLCDISTVQNIITFINLTNTLSISTCFSVSD